MSTSSPATPVRITLPTGEVISLSWIPYEGWGYEAGRSYTVIERNELGEETARHWWAIPPLTPLSRPASRDSHLQDQSRAA